MTGRDDTLLEVWRWLPLFRLVAETESVTRASRAFAVSPPAVSRALKQVETAIGVQLFDRRGRRMILNPQGHALLQAVAEAEARLGAVLGDLGDQEAAGHVRIGTVGQLGRVFIAPAVRSLAEEHPRLEVSITHLEPAEALERLKGSSLDLFLALNVSVGDPLRAQRLAELEIGIYAGRGHPLFQASRVTHAAIAEHPFAAQLRPGLMRSVWPSELKRRVTLQTDAHAVALEACLSGSHLMAMERVIAKPLLDEGRLRELDASLLPAAKLVLVQKSGRAPSKIVARVAQAIVETVRALT
ncbi:MAG: LysR family transcriptional regulator [Myxococcota bacterium]